MTRYSKYIYFKNRQLDTSLPDSIIKYFLNFINYICEYINNDNFNNILDIEPILN